MSNLIENTRDWASDNVTDIAASAFVLFVWGVIFSLVKKSKDKDTEEPISTGRAFVTSLFLTLVVLALLFGGVTVLAIILSSM